MHGFTYLGLCTRNVPQAQLFHSALPEVGIRKFGVLAYMQDRICITKEVETCRSGIDQCTVFVGFQLACVAIACNGYMIPFILN
jgi:hypothetical protein